jgi:restriction system protein
LLVSVRSTLQAFLRRLSGNKTPRAAAADAVVTAGNRTSWRDFHAGVEAMFVAQGYQIAQVAGEAPHREVDLVLRKNRETFLVQCKQWRDAKVAIDACEALYTIMKSRNAPGGFIVTTGRFSRESAAYASACNIRLIDGAALDVALKKVQTRSKV